MKEQVFRVLHVAPTPFFSDRGCHIRIRGIVLALEAKGCENLVCTYPIGRDVDGVNTARCASIPGYTKTEAGPSGFKYLADLLLVMTVAKCIRSYKPDILHCHLHEGVLIGWLAKILTLKRGLPIVFDMQGSLVGELDQHAYFQKSTYLKRVFQKLEQVIVSLAKIFLCSSQASAALLVDRFGVDPSLVRIARDGSDIKVVKRDRDRKEARKEGISTVVYSGGLTKSKGLEQLKKVILEAHRRELCTEFLIIGYPTGEMEDLISRHGLENFVVLTGQVPYEELAGYLSEATLAVEPKLSGSGEASGKLVNYMMAALPIVCFDTHNNRDILGQLGFFSPEGDIAAFVDNIDYVLHNGSEAKAMAQRGNARAEALFSWSSAADQAIAAYIQLYE